MSVKWFDFFIIGCFLLNYINVCRGAEIFSNRNGGGRWSDASSWESKIIPRSTDKVIIRANDTIIFDTSHEKPGCSGIVVEQDGKFKFAEGKRTLIVNGNIEVSGIWEMGPGSTLKIAVNKNIEYGLLCRDGSYFKAEGSYGNKDCVITSFVQDGKNNGYITFSGAKEVIIKNCELSYLGGKSGNIQTEGVYVGGCENVEVKNCSIHHNNIGMSIRYNHKNGIFEENEIFNNPIGILFYYNSNCYVIKNHFHHNNSGLYFSLPQQRLVNIVERNLFTNNTNGLFLCNQYDSKIRNNIYSNNTVAVKLDSRGIWYLKNEYIYANNYGIKYPENPAGGGILALEQCILGGNEKGEILPNRIADIFMAGEKGRESDARDEVLMDNCKLLSPTPVANLGKQDRVISENHNQVKGETKKWGY